MSSTNQPSNPSPVHSQTKNPPRSFLGILGHLGPGLIIAASIVGSGELIATTITGAKAGLQLLWLIILGCVVKVFAQIEIGRFTIGYGLPTLSALNTVPGPRIKGRGNWLVWYWFFMWICSIGQLGGIVGVVGQTLAFVQPITSQGREFQAIGVMETQSQLTAVIDRVQKDPENSKDIESSSNRTTPPNAMDANGKEQVVAPELLQMRREYLKKYHALENISDVEILTTKLKPSIDDRIWAVPVAFITSLMLLYGGYHFIQGTATTMVAIFTLVTLGNAIGLQTLPVWRISWDQWVGGLAFGLPKGNWTESLGVAFATVGIIGVGAAELIQYPYWCLEKGYAKETGTYDGSPAWGERARGWFRIMKTDIWVSMVIYTLATLGFFVLGAGILHRAGIRPEESKLLLTLSVMYEPVLGSWASITFLIGAFFVLYSTFYVANASHARTFSDAIGVMGFVRSDEQTQAKLVRFLSGLFPILCLLIYLVFPSPTWLVLLSGAAQAVMLPMLGFAALFFRYQRCRQEMRPSALFDVGLWLSVGVLFLIGIASLVLEIQKRL